MWTFITWLKDDVKDGHWLDIIADVIHTCICSWAKCKKVTYFSYDIMDKKTSCKRCGYWTRGEQGNG